MNLGRYIFFRLVAFVFQFTLGMFTIFFIFRIIPYDPTAVILFGAGRISPEEQDELVKTIHAEWGIDKPLYVQYFNFMRDLIAHGSLGNSWYGGSLNLMLKGNIAPTFILLGLSLLVIPISLVLGVLTAKRTQSKTDSFIKFLTSILYGIPYYIFAVLFLLLADFQEWELEPIDTYTWFYEIYLHHLVFALILVFFLYRLLIGMVAARRSPNLNEFFNRVLISLQKGLPYYIVPLLFLIIAQIFGLNREPQFVINTWFVLYNQQLLSLLIVLVVFSSHQYRLVRKEFMDVLFLNYIRTARAKGLSERSVIYKHALRNILPPLIISYTSLIPALLTAIVVLESLFGTPGLGWIFVYSAIWVDWGVLIGLSAIFLLVNGIINMLSDIFLTASNPLGLQY